MHRDKNKDDRHGPFFLFL